MAILIVEDNPTNAMIIKHLAKKVTDKEIRVASDGTTALAMCHVETFSMLLVDNFLPGMSGLQFAKAVRLMDRYQRTPIVMITAETEPKLEDDAKAAGVTAFLHKPVEAVAFRQLLTDYLGNSVL